MDDAKGLPRHPTSHRRNVIQIVFKPDRQLYFLQRMHFELFPFGCAKVRRVFLRQPFFQFHLGCGVDRGIGEVLPLVWVFGGVVELFTAVGVADVVPSLRTDGMVATQADHRRILPLGFRVAKQRSDTAPVQSVSRRQSA